MIIEREIDGEIYVKCETYEDYRKVIHEFGFTSHVDFFIKTRYCWSDLKGKFFTMIGRKIYTKELLWIEEYKDGLYK